MAKAHFNKDLDEYVRARKHTGKKQLFNFSINMKSKEEEKKAAAQKKKAHEEALDVPEEHVKKVLESQPTGQDYEGSARKEGFLSRLATSVFGVREDYSEQGSIIVDREPEQHSAIEPELVDALKIAGKWLNKLDPEVKKEFKESQDYAKYKFYLDKFGLTRKKE